MNILPLKIKKIPALLYGNSSEKLFIYVHGRYSSKDEAGNFAEMLTDKGGQVLGL